MNNLGEILDGLRRERWENEGLVGSFKLELGKAGFAIVEKRGNSFVLRGKATELLLSAHEYTPQILKTEGKGWWAVSQSFIEEAEIGEGKIPWGTVFLLGSSTSEAWTGFWLPGDKFEEVEPGSPDSDKKRHIYLEKLEKVAKPFHSAGEFCCLVGLM